MFTRIRFHNTITTPRMSNTHPIIGIRDPCNSTRKTQRQLAPPDEWLTMLSPPPPHPHVGRFTKVPTKTRNAFNEHRHQTSCPPPPLRCFLCLMPASPMTVPICKASMAMNLCLAVSLCIPPSFIPRTFTPFPIGTLTHDCTYYSHKYKHSVRPATKATIPPPPTGLASCSTVFALHGLCSDDRTAYLDVSSPHPTAFYATHTSKNEKPGHA